MNLLKRKDDIERVWNKIPELNKLELLAAAVDSWKRKAFTNSEQIQILQYSKELGWDPEVVIAKGWGYSAFNL